MRWVVVLLCGLSAGAVASTVFVPRAWWRGLASAVVTALLVWACVVLLVVVLVAAGGGR